MVLGAWDCTSKFLFGAFKAAKAETAFFLWLVQPHFNLNSIKVEKHIWELPSGNQTWQRKMDHLSVIFSLKPAFIGDFPQL